VILLPKKTLSGLKKLKKKTCNDVEQNEIHGKCPRRSWARGQMGNPSLYTCTMKTKLPLLVFVASCFLLQSALGQGALTPPGAPAPTMNTLEQIYGRTDARIPITNSASVVAISTAGSYYLTTNLTVSSGDGIDIYTGGVTLDLNGYTISSTAASATGMGIKFDVSGLSDVTIGNGHIQGGVTNNGSGVYGGSGFKNGIYYGGAPVNVLVSRVTVSGCLLNGIYLNFADSTVVESCTVRTIGGFGIFASTVKQSSAIDCGNNAINGDQVSDCHGESSGSANGVYANSSALNCFGSCGSGTGVNAATAENCTGYSTSGNYGVSATTALNCNGYSTDGIGVYATTAQNCYGYSTDGTGVYATGTADACYGFSASGTGLSAFIASVCHGETTSGSATNITHNVNSY
jgi:hypothetical protein